MRSGAGCALTTLFVALFDLLMAGVTGVSADAEYLALGAALQNAEEAGIWPPAIAAARFLAVTGWRSGEALGCAGMKSTCPPDGNPRRYQNGSECAPALP